MFLSILDAQSRTAVGTAAVHSISQLVDAADRPALDALIQRRSSAPPARGAHSGAPRPVSVLSDGDAATSIGQFNHPSFPSPSSSSSTSSRCSALKTAAHRSAAWRSHSELLFGSPGASELSPTGPERRCSTELVCFRPTGSQAGLSPGRTAG